MYRIMCNFTLANLSNYTFNSVNTLQMDTENTNHVSQQLPILKPPKLISEAFVRFPLHPFPFLLPTGGNLEKQDAKENNTLDPDSSKIVNVIISKKRKLVPTKVFSIIGSP